VKLSETDKREVCPRCGWVGRAAFQRDRHDLCEPPDEDVFEEDDPDDEDADPSDEEAKSRWSRAAARKRGIPPKKTLAVRRITQVELAEGRDELRAMGANGPYERPKKRGDCQWCPVCQLVRDGKSNGLDALARETKEASAPVKNGGSMPAAATTKKETRLVCGHRVGEVIWHSRPCVFVACKHALFLDSSETGSIILNFPHLEPGQMRPDQSCSLDLADRGPMTLEDIAMVTNLTRERIRQVELRALIRRARPSAIALGLSSEDAAAVGARHQVGPGAALAETGVEGAVPSDVATLLSGSPRGDSGGDDD
jgi:hypothetical protein